MIVCRSLLFLGGKVNIYREEKDNNSWGLGAPISDLGPRTSDLGAERDAEV